MFDIKNIDFIKTDKQRQNRNGKNYSFVGLKKSENPNESKLEFWLPLGFDKFDDTFANCKQFFFSIYKTFKTYKIRKKDYIEENLTNDRDGVFEYHNGFTFKKKNAEQTIFYGKLNSLDRILEGYDELRISSLEKKQVRSNDIDYSKIDKYMHQAVYLEDDVIYLDELNISKNVLIRSSPTVVQMFCYIFLEIKKELFEINTLPQNIIELSSTFEESYLSPNSSLFSEESYQDTISILKNILDEIDQFTLYKDSDFWHFYEAIEAFLYGEKEQNNQGIYFGIDNFYDIWEDMCQSYVLSSSEYRTKILFADVNGSLKTRVQIGLNAIIDDNPFRMEINNGFKPRYLKPDLVILKNGNILDETILTNLFIDIPDTFTIASNEGNPITITNHKIIINKHVKDNIPRINEIYEFYLKKNPKYIDNPNNEYILGKHYLYFQKEVLLYLNRINTKILIDFEILEPLIQIVDYKYMREADYNDYNPSSFTINEIGEKENKIKDDIHKQLIYEWTTQKNIKKCKTISEFWIPYYSENLDFEGSKFKVKVNDIFEKSKISVYKVNFNLLMSAYTKMPLT